MYNWFGERGLRTKPIQKAKMKLYKYRIRLFDTGEVGDSFSIWNSPRVLNTNNMCTAIWIVIFTRLLYICCIRLYLEKYSRHQMEREKKKTIPIWLVAGCGWVFDRLGHIIDIHNSTCLPHFVSSRKIELLCHRDVNFLIRSWLWRDKY